MEARKEKNGPWLSVPQFGDWDQKGQVPDYSLDFSKIRETRKQNKTNISRASLGNEEEFMNSTTTSVVNIGHTHTEHQHPHYDQNSHSPTVRFLATLICYSIFCASVQLLSTVIVFVAIISKEETRIRTIYKILKNNNNNNNQRDSRIFKITISFAKVFQFKVLFFFFSLWFCFLCFRGRGCYHGKSNSNSTVNRVIRLTSYATRNGYSLYIVMKAIELK